MADNTEENYIWDQIGSEINGGVTSNWRSRGSSSLSNDGTVLAVGSPDNADNGLNSGKVSIFNYSTVSHSWIQVGNDIKGQNIGDYFGISIKLSDDGRGLDKEKIIKKAIEKKFISTSNPKELDERDIYSLIF